MVNSWKEIDAQQAFNTAIAAAALETYPFADARGTTFNGLVVSNAGSIDILLYLDGQNAPGRVFSIPRNTTFIISPSDGINFRFVQQKNVDAATAEVANNILFRASYSVPVR